MTPSSLVMKVGTKLEVSYTKKVSVVKGNTFGNRKISNYTNFSRRGVIY